MGYAADLIQRTAGFVNVTLGTMSICCSAMKRRSLISCFRSLAETVRSTMRSFEKPSMSPSRLAGLVLPKSAFGGLAVLSTGLPLRVSRCCAGLKNALFVRLCCCCWLVALPPASAPLAAGCDSIAQFHWPLAIPDVCQSKAKYGSTRLRPYLVTKCNLFGDGAL